MNKTRLGNYIKRLSIILIVFTCGFIIGRSPIYTNAFNSKSSLPDKQVDNPIGSIPTNPKDKDPGYQEDIKGIENVENVNEINDKNDIDDIADVNDLDHNDDKDMDNDIDGNMGNDDEYENLDEDIDNDKGKDSLNNEHDKPENNDEGNGADTEIVPTASLIHSSANKDLKRVAITFDDGPDDYFTPKVLDILKEYDVKATFFVLGSMAHKNPDVLKRIDDEGHVVASHGWGHKNFTKLSKNKAIVELERTNNLIKKVTGKSNTLFRLPYGAFNEKVLETIAEQGFHNIHWSIDPKDWSGVSSNKILRNIKQNIHPGAIILLHSSGSNKSIPNSIKALPRIIEFLQNQGYELVTIPELLDIPMPEEDHPPAQEYQSIDQNMIKANMSIR